MKLVTPLRFISLKNSCSDINRKRILPKMIEAFLTSFMEFMTFVSENIPLKISRRYTKTRNHLGKVPGLAISGLLQKLQNQGFLSAFHSPRNLCSSAMVFLLFIFV